MSICAHTTSSFQNIVAFDLRDTEADQSLDLACLCLARDLLSSKARLLTPTIDLRASLRERLRRSHVLIALVAQSGLTGSLRNETRVEMSQCAQKLASASGLWHYYSTTR